MVGNLSSKQAENYVQLKILKKDQETQICL